LLGSPIAGTTIMAVNYLRSRSGGKGFVGIVIGIAVTILAALFGNKLPTYLSLTIAIGLLLLIKSVAQILQGPAMADHVTRGGKVGWRRAAAGIGVACLIVIFGVVFGYFPVQQFTRGDSKVTIGTQDAVFYSGSATRDDATALGQKLKEMGCFTDRGVTVFLKKGRGRPIVSFAVRDGAWDQPEMLLAFEQIGGQVARFLAEPMIAVRMVNTDRDVKKEMTAGEVISGSKDGISFTGTATQAESRALGQVLVTAGYLVDNGRT
jgi:hypothetical protein